MHFQPKNKDSFSFKLMIGEEELKKKKHLLYLGLILDNKLNLNEI